MFQKSSILELKIDECVRAKRSKKRRQPEQNGERGEPKNGVANLQRVVAKLEIRDFDDEQNRYQNEAFEDLEFVDDGGKTESIEAADAAQNLIGDVKTFVTQTACAEENPGKTGQNVA